MTPPARLNGANRSCSRCGRVVAIRHRALSLWADHSFRRVLTRPSRAPPIVFKSIARRVTSTV
jgi:hypothetical protein